MLLTMEGGWCRHALFEVRVRTLSEGMLMKEVRVSALRSHNRLLRSLLKIDVFLKSSLCACEYNVHRSKREVTKEQGVKDKCVSL